MRFECYHALCTLCSVLRSTLGVLDLIHMSDIMHARFEKEHGGVRVLQAEQDRVEETEVYSTPNGPVYTTFQHAPAQNEYNPDNVRSILVSTCLLAGPECCCKCCCMHDAALSACLACSSAHNCM